MSTRKRAGIRAARGLLSLLEENSAEEFGAAESILGGEKELAKILQLLRKFKEHELKEHEEEPLSIERLREIVRSELVNLGLQRSALMKIAFAVLGARIFIPPNATVEDVIDRVFQAIEERKDAPSAQVDALTRLLVDGFESSNLEPEPRKAKIASLLRELTIQALTENTIMFPSLHALAELRVRWAGELLPYHPKESRRHLAARLLDDAERLRPDDYLEITRDLLREGMRGPADSEIAAVRRMKRKKVNGE